MAGTLRALLAELGYARGGRGWSHPDGRRLVFVGDYIDRGPDPVGTVRLVSELCDDGAAFALLGNHDVNAIQFSLRTDEGGSLDPASAHRAAVRVLERRGDPESGWLRDHRSPATRAGGLPKNIEQHAETLERTTPAEYASIVSWAATLPAWLELPGLRVVHAAWIARAIDALERWSASEGLPGLGVFASCIEGAIGAQRARRSGAVRCPDAGQWRALLDLGGARAEESAPDRSAAVALERILKGVEARLPPGVGFLDPGMCRRDTIRVRWFEPGADQRVADHALMPRAARECIARDTGEATLGPELAGIIPMTAAEAYPADERPVIFGHYGLHLSDAFIDWPSNVACVDMKVFDDRGALAAYRWDGERRLARERLVAVASAG